MTKKIGTSAFSVHGGRSTFGSLRDVVRCHLNGCGRAPREGPQGGGETALGQLCRMDSVGQALQLCDCLAKVGVRGSEQSRRVGRRGADQAPGAFQSHRDGDELLLGAVVQVAFDRPARVIGGFGDACAGRLHLAEPQPVGDVPECHDRAAAAGEINRRGRIGDRDLRAVFADEPVVL